MRSLQSLEVCLGTCTFNSYLGDLERSLFCPPIDIINFPLLYEMLMSTTSSEDFCEWDFGGNYLLFELFIYWVNKIVKSLWEILFFSVFSSDLRGDPVPGSLSWLLESVDMTEAQKLYILNLKFLLLKRVQRQATIPEKKSVLSEISSPCFWAIITLAKYQNKCIWNI